MEWDNKIENDMGYICVDGFRLNVLELWEFEKYLTEIDIESYPLALDPRDSEVTIKYKGLKLHTYVSNMDDIINLIKMCRQDFGILDDKAFDEHLREENDNFFYRNNKYFKYLDDDESRDKANIRLRRELNKKKNKKITNNNL